MFFNTLFYKKDKLLNSKLFSKEIESDIHILEDVYKKHAADIKKQALRYNVDQTEADTLALEVVAEFTQKLKHGHYADLSPDKIKKKVVYFTFNKIKQYWEKNGKQNYLMRLLDDGDDYHISSEWDTENNEQDKKETNSRYFQFATQCIDGILDNNNEQLITNLKIFMLQTYANATQEELAAEIKTTIGGIKSRLHKIRDKLKKCIADKAKKN